MYDDDYRTCAETYATFRLYPGDVDPDQITAALGLEPSSIQRKGDLRGQRRLAHNGWFLSSEKIVESRDVRRHIDWLLEQLTGAEAALREFASAGTKMDIFCYWFSAYGQGGPTLSPRQMERLASLGLECGFDVYCNGD